MTWTYWLIAGLIALGLEAAINGFILVFFGLGALITALFAPWISTEQEWALFSILSIALILIFRQKIRDRIQTKPGQDLKDDFMHSLVGKSATVQKDIQAHSPGRIEVHGSTWTAHAKEFIPAGTTVTITHIQNMDLWVQKEQA